MGLLNSQRLENKMSLRANPFFAPDFFNQLILSEMSNLNSPKADSQKTDVPIQLFQFWSDTDGCGIPLWQIIFNV